MRKNRRKEMTGTGGNERKTFYFFTKKVYNKKD